MECSICYENLTDPPKAPTVPKRGRKCDPKNPKNTSLLVCPPCGHIYHRVCIEEWLITKQSDCPSCRKKCEKRALRAVFLPTAGVVSSAQTGTDDDDDDDTDDDDGDKGKGSSCGKCDKLAKQLEELKKEKEELQKQVDVERKQVKSLEKMLDGLTADEYTTPAPATGTTQQNTQPMDDDDSSDDEDDTGFSSWF